MGKKWIDTPNMDRLAGRGVFFTNAYAANPLCVPSRNSMITGRYPHTTGIEKNADLASWHGSENSYFTGTKFKSLGTYFQSAGYQTAYFGKWHLNYKISDEEAHGFATVRHFLKPQNDASIPGAVDTFLTKTRKTPFLLWASFVNPHDICQWARFQQLPEGSIGKVPPVSQWPPMKANAAPPKNETPAMRLMRKSYHNNRKLFPVGNYSDFDWRRLRWGYYRLIEKVDAQIGRLLEVLKTHGYDKNTLIVFTSDHGESMGAHRFNQKTVFYEESARVPFILTYAGKLHPGTNKTLVNTGTDLLPTLLDFAHIEKPDYLPGISLKKAARQNSTLKSRSYIVSENNMSQGGPVNGQTPVVKGRMVRSPRYKYCLYDTLAHRETLFDLKTDPGETVNIAGQDSVQAILAQHRAYLKTFARTHNDTHAAEMLNEVKEKRSSDSQNQWDMHIIDNTSFGADGTKLCYANRDSLPDIVTGWEQGKVVRLYFNPGPGHTDLIWSFVEVPAPGSEDAFVVDLDNDGFKDIVTLSEDRQQRITFHWAPPDTGRYTKSRYWKSEDLPVSTGRKWMFGIPMDVDHKNGIDLVVGSKKKRGTIGWLESPENPRQVGQWHYHEMSPAGWIMSIKKKDMNQDGVDDILISDRKGASRGIRWLENPGPGSAQKDPWKNHVVGLRDGEPMFLAVADLNSDGLDDILVPDLTEGLVLFSQTKNNAWKRVNIRFPRLSGTRGKAVAVGDINQNGQPDIVSSYEGAEEKAGIMWTSNLLNKHRKDHNVSGAAGIKFDLVRLLDFDGDGDLDILTSEENNNSSTVAGLGVVWYENPSR